LKVEPERSHRRVSVLLRILLERAAHVELGRSHASALVRVPRLLEALREEGHDLGAADFRRRLGPEGSLAEDGTDGGMVAQWAEKQAVEGLRAVEGLVCSQDERLELVEGDHMMSAEHGIDGGIHLLQHSLECRDGLPDLVGPALVAELLLKQPLQQSPVKKACTGARCSNAASLEALNRRRWRRRRRWWRWR
jgi:hypothetical protein